jgi:hypothetical protein
MMGNMCVGEWERGVCRKVGINVGDVDNLLSGFVGSGKMTR